jgi:hypothetical protein
MQHDFCSSPKSDILQHPDIPEQFRIILIVNGNKQEYDVRYLYWSILKNPIDPATGILFTEYQRRRIIQTYRKNVGSTQSMTFHS